MPKKFNAKKAGEAAMFNGKSPEEVSQMLGIPKGFEVTEFLGIPIKQVPFDYLKVMINGAIYEARALRKKVQDAIAFGEEQQAESTEKEETPQ